jgi:hypothetical protein
VNELPQYTPFGMNDGAPVVTVSSGGAAPAKRLEPVLGSMAWLRAMRPRGVEQNTMPLGRRCALGYSLVSSVISNSAVGSDSGVHELEEGTNRSGM